MQIHCPQCEATLDADEPSGQCPHCGSEISTRDPDQTATFIQEASAEAALESGRSLGHFELLESLGRGHFGSVYKARDVRLDRLVALKFPRQDLYDEAEIQKFFREARAAAQLRHPNIVSVHDVGRDGNDLYIVSDLIEGRTLHERLSEKPPTPRQAAGWCATLADALQYAHDAGVVHRDLKPANVMVDVTDTPFIMDFGLAKREQGEATMTMEGHILGTPAYMPPEQASGQGHRADGRSDVYSLGVILYEMLTGVRPFSGKLETLLYKVIHEEPTAPRGRNPRLARDLETICLKAMAKDPAARYQTAGELAEDLRRFCAGEAILARPVGFARRFARRVRRNPLPAAVLVSAAVLIAAAGVYFQGRAQEQQQITGLTRELSRMEDAADWSPPSVSGMLAVVDELRELSPADARAALERLEQKYVEHLSGTSSIGELADVESVFRELDVRAPGIADAAREAYAARQKNWLLVFDTADAGFDPSTVFSPDDAAWFRGEEVVDESDTALQDPPLTDVGDTGGDSTAADALSPAHRVQRIITRVPCEGSVELTATLSGGWDSADRVDLLLHAGAEHSTTIEHIEYSADGRLLASGSRREAFVWDVERDMFTMQYDAPTGQTIGGLALSPDGAELAVALHGKNSRQPTDRVVLLDTSTGQPSGAAIPGRKGAQCVAFSRNGKLLAYGDWEGVHVWDLQTRQLRQTLAIEAKNRGAACVAFSRRGGLIAGGMRNGSVAVWDVADGEIRALLEGHEHWIVDLSISPNGNYLAATDRASTKLWELPGGQPLRSLPGATQVALVAGDHLVTATAGVGIQTLDLTSGVPETLHRDTTSRMQWAISFRALAVSPRGDRVACQNADNRVMLLHRGTGEVLRTMGANAFLFRLATESVAGRRESIAGSWQRGNDLVVQIQREKVPLYESRIAATSVPEGPLTLRARLIGTELSFQVNNQAPHTHYLVFPRQRLESGSYGLRVASEAKLDRLGARRQAPPEAPSLLEEGDELFAGGDYEQALARYEEQARKTENAEPGSATGAVHQEARVKAGFCLLALNRNAEAEERFMEVSVEAGQRWPLVAGCQLWLMYVKQGRYERPEGDTSDRGYASDVFDQLSIRFRFDQLAALVPQDVRREIVGEYVGRVWGTRLLDPLTGIDTLVERADRIDEFFGASPTFRRFTKRSLVHAYQYADRMDDALLVARDLVQNPAYWGRSGKDAPVYMHSAIEEYMWLLRNLGRAGEALGELDKLIYARPGELHKGAEDLLVERVRIHVALGDRAAAEADLEQYFQFADSTVEGRAESRYIPFSGACLMAGFLKLDGGDHAGAQETWSRGVYSNWYERVSADEANARQLRAYPTLASLDGNPMLQGILLGSLTGELTDEEANSVLAKAVRYDGQSSVILEIVNTHLSMTPEVVRSLCRSPQAMDFTRRMAYREVTLPEFRRSPAILFGATLSRQLVFEGRVSPEQDLLLWQLTKDMYDDYLNGRLSFRQIPLMLAAWHGRRSRLGWAGVRTDLSAEIRAPLGYLFGVRSLRGGNTETARQFFEDALADITERNDAVISRLVDKELAGLKSKPVATPR